MGELHPLHVPLLHIKLRISCATFSLDVTLWTWSPGFSLVPGTGWPASVLESDGARKVALCVCVYVCVRVCGLSVSVVLQGV